MWQERRQAVEYGMSLARKRQWFAEPPDTDTAKNAADGGQQSEAGPRAYTQAEIDAIIRDRLARERQKYADYDALKEAAERWRQHEEAQKTAEQRQAEELAKLQAELETTKRQAAETLLKARVIAAAGQMRAKVPEDAWRLVDPTALSEADDGAVAEAVKALIEAGRLPTLDKPTAPPLDGGVGSERRMTPTPTLTERQRRAARFARMTDEEYAKALDELQRRAKET